MLQNHEIQRVGSPVPEDGRRARHCRHQSKSADHGERGHVPRGLVLSPGHGRDQAAGIGGKAGRLTPIREVLPAKFAAEYKKPVQRHDPPGASRLANYSWPGNIRELENVIGNACMMVDGPVIDVGDLPEPIRGQSRELPAQDDMLISLRGIAEASYMRVLERVGGNKSHAAEILGISRATIYQLLGQARTESSSLTYFGSSAWRAHRPGGHCGGLRSRGSHRVRRGPAKLHGVRKEQQCPDAALRAARGGCRACTRMLAARI